MLSISPLQTHAVDGVAHLLQILIFTKLLDLKIYFYYLAMHVACAW